MSAPTLRERIAAEMWRHKMVRPAEHVDTWCTCLSWSIERGRHGRDERAWTGHLTDAALAVVADWLTEDEQAEAVNSTHHFHGEQCLCGYSSERSRSRTEHITNLTLAALADRVREGEA